MVHKGHGVSENCEEFGEMQIVRHAKYVGTMIGLNGHDTFVGVVLSWLCVDNQCFHQKFGWAIVISRSTRFRCSIGFVSAPDEAALTAENKCLSVYHRDRATLSLLRCCGFRPDVVWFHSIRFAVHCRVQHGRPRFANDLRKSRWLVGTIALLSLFFLPFENKSFFFLPWPFTRRSHSRHRESQDRSHVTVWLTSCATWKLFRVLLVLSYSLVSFASSSVWCVQHKDFTPTNMITLTALDA